jgi:hypothetical protein
MSNIAKSTTEKIITDTPMTLAQAVLYGVAINGGTVEIGRNRDVYELLETCEFPENHTIIGLAVHTTGWAAPTNENGEVEGRPSEHPERQRCALVVCRTAQEFCSAVKLESRDEVEYEEEEAQGSLWEALGDCLARLGA